MSLTSEMIAEQAVTWHLKLANASPEDWARFVEWLEADLRHNAAYEAIADADADYGEALRLGTGEPYPRQEQKSLPWLFKLTAPIAMAASLAALAVWTLGWGNDKSQVVVAVPGRPLTVALGDGTKIVLQGGSRLTLHGKNSRSAELVSGQAFFTVHHDVTRPFAVTVGERRIVDVGTEFDVLREGQELRVEVAEGSVRFEQGATRLRLNAGQTVNAEADTIVEGVKPVSEIGGWTRGRLVFRQAPLSEVVQEISRARGIAIGLESSLSARTFTGVIQLGGDDDTLRTRVELLLGVRIAKTKRGWSIEG
jgi:transmembrane sensor